MNIKLVSIEKYAVGFKSRILSAILINFLSKLMRIKNDTQRGLNSNDRQRASSALPPVPATHCCIEMSFAPFPKTDLVFSLFT